MRNTITILILAILIMSMAPFTIAEKPEPLAASVTPSFVVDNSDTGDEGGDTDTGTDTGTRGGGGGGGGGLTVSAEPTEEETQTSAQEDEGISREQLTKTKVVRKTLLSHYVASVTPVFRVWRVNKSVSNDPNATKMIKSLSDNATRMFLHLSRAEQKRILDMSQEQAEEMLMNYQLIAVNKSLLYRVRVIPVPVLIKARERVVDAKESYNEIKEEVDEEKEKFENAKLGRDEEQATEHAKRYMLKTAELVIKALERVKYNVESSDDLSDEEAQEILAEINETINEMNVAKANVEAAETKAEVQEAGKVILHAWRRTRIRLMRHVTRLIHAKLGEIIKRSEHLEDKLDCSLQSMEEQGINVTDIDSMVEEFSTHVDDARSKFNDARQYLDQAKELKSQGPTDEELQEAERLISEAKVLIDEAQRDLKEAHELLKQIVRAIKAAGGEIVACEEPELEEDEVYEVVEEEEQEEVVEGGMECTESSDCEGLPHPEIMCVGEWKCIDNECVYECGVEESDEFCGSSTNGSCEADDDCMTGGCSNQVCQSKSEEPIITTCEWRDCYDASKYGVVCGCVDGKCQWSSS